MFAIAAGAALSSYLTIGPAPVAAQGAGGQQAGAAQQGGQRYRAPRNVYGQADLSGIWQALNTAWVNLEDHAGALGEPAGLSVVVGGEIPYRPETLKKRGQNFERRQTDDPDVKCYSPGVPRATYMPYPFQIFQAANYVVFTYEYQHLVRLIYLNKPHPDGALGFWMGDSRAKWDGDTLVVDVAALHGDSWLDHAGNHHTDEMHVVERVTRTSADHLLYEATIEDPKTYTLPWTIRMPLYKRVEPNLQLLEYECVAYLEKVLYPKPGTK